MKQCMNFKFVILFALTLLVGSTVYGQDNVIDEVVWVVGDEAILKSEVEEARMSALYEGRKLSQSIDNAYLSAGFNTSAAIRGDFRTRLDGVLREEPGALQGGTSVDERLVHQSSFDSPAAGQCSSLVQDGNP